VKLVNHRRHNFAAMVFCLHDLQLLTQLTRMQKVIVILNHQLIRVIHSQLVY